MKTNERMTMLVVSALFPVLAGLLSVPASAQSSGLGVMTRGSVMIFPYIDFANPARTIVTVTNTNTDRTVCGGAFRMGDVTVYLAYFDDNNCLVTDRFHDLTPADTLTIRADELIAGADGHGWLYAEARDPNTGRPIDFDFLIGSVNLGDQHPNMKWWYGAYSFESLAAEIGSLFGINTCGHSFVGPNADGVADFNGREYAPFPQSLYVDLFIGEGTPPELSMGATIDSRLILCSPSSTPTTMTMRLYNNNEVVINRVNQFTCLFRASLASIAPNARHENLRTSYDPRELGGLPYGWLSLTADRGILGCFVQRVIRSDGKPIQGFGRTLHFSGQRFDVTIRRFGV